MSPDATEDWLYHLPAFLDQVRASGVHDVLANLDAAVDGVLYHHRGVRVPGHNATFLWSDDGFELEVDAVGDRAAWAVFDADASWDFYLSRATGDAPCLAWVTDAEYAADDAEEFDTKAEAVGMGRFSFGLYLQSPEAWQDLEDRVGETDAPFFIYRPSGRTLVPETGLTEYEDVVPAELLDDDDDPPEYVGLEAAHISTE